jgi:DNA-binding GntR family transcriptional regulator
VGILKPIAQEAAPLRRKISASLRDAISSGTLQPGARLVEKDLCLNLGVSRTALREALRELEAEGLLERGTRGVIVAGLTTEEARNVYAVRAALEGLVAEQFAKNASDSDFEAMEGVTKALSRAYQQQDFASIIGEKERFYEVLCLGARNQVVLDLLTKLNSKINRLRSLSRSDPGRGAQSLREIEAIVAALRTRNPELSRAAAIAHVERAAAAALRFKEALSDPQAA